MSSANQAGACGVVTAPHHIPPGIAWMRDEVRRRIGAVRTMSKGALEWEFAESLTVAEVIYAY